MSLTGKKILITRPLEQAETIVRLLRERGAEAIHFPTIHILPPASWEDCDEAIDQYRTYHAIIMTSVNAVRCFYSRAVERGLRPGLVPQAKVYVVGAKTAEAVATFGVAATRFPGVTNVTTLAEALCAMPVAGKRYLFPKGNLAGNGISEALRARQATVNEVIVYETAAGKSGERSEAADVSAGIDAAHIGEMLRARAVDAVTFFSPSSVENFFAVIPCDAVSATVLAAIGPTTADALTTLSLPVRIVAAQPTSEELVAALDEFFV